jgi:hypothetical protein
LAEAKVEAKAESMGSKRVEMKVGLQSVDEMVILSADSKDE